jgi:hypothetical protein
MPYLGETTYTDAQWPVESSMIRHARERLTRRGRGRARTSPGDGEASSGRKINSSGRRGRPADRGTEAAHCSLPIELIRPKSISQSERAIAKSRRSLDRSPVPTDRSKKIPSILLTALLNQSCRRRMFFHPCGHNLDRSVTSSNAPIWWLIESPVSESDDRR